MRDIIMAAGGTWTTAVVSLLVVAAAVLTLASLSHAACSFGCPAGKYEASPCGTSGDRVCVREYSTFTYLFVSLCVVVALHHSNSIADISWQ